MGSGRRLSLLPLLLPLLPLLPAAWGDCGPLPNITHAEPPRDAEHQGSFGVGSKVTYRCQPGFVKRPSLPDTVQCLSNSQWSNLPEFCGRSCPSPLRVRFARLSQKDETLNFYAVNTTVKYICRPGYENTTDQLPTSTCLDNLTWSAVPELCHRKSCGIPANPEHGKVIANDHLFGARAEVVCNRGYTLKGASPLISCSLRGNEVAWSRLPACQAISCPPPPPIPNGMHNSSGMEEVMYDSVVVYTCDPGLQLVGNETLRCATENGVDGVWSGSPPECRAGTTATTTQTEHAEEKIAANPYWLASALIPVCIVLPVVLGILAGIVMRRKSKNKQDPPKITDDGKQPVPWHPYFCQMSGCHVCPACGEGLHTALAPHTEPARPGCAACEEWLSTQPGTLSIYSVPSISDGESQSPAGTRSPAKAADLLRGEGTGEAVLERSEAEQPMDHDSNHHVCPICEHWLRAHLAHSDSRPTAPGERPGEPRQHDEGLRGPVCPPCADQLHLSLVHRDAASRPVCPLAGDGTPAHLVPRSTPSCHLCPICGTPTHAHLCQAPHG